MMHNAGKKFIMEQKIKNKKNAHNEKSERLAKYRKTYPVTFIQVELCKR